MILRAHPLVFLPVLGMAMLMLPGCWDAGLKPGEAASRPMILLPMASFPWHYGYISEQGKFAIKPQWHQANSFHEGFAFVQDRETKLWAVIDTSGRYVCPPQFEEIDISDGGFQHGLVAVKKGGLWGFLDRQLKVQIPFVFTDATWFSEGLCGAADKTGRWGYINVAGQWCIDPQFDFVHPFSEGWAVACEGTKGKFIDREGKPVPMPREVNADSGFQEGLALERRDGKLYFIDTHGTEVMGPFDAARGFHKGLASVNRNGLWGVIDRNQKTVIDFKYTLLTDFSEGLIVWVIEKETGTENGSGYLDLQGNVVIRFRTARGNLGSFENGYANVKADGQEKYLRTDGTVLARRKLW